MMADYVDLLITDSDVTLDSAGEPVLVYDADCITQDIKHLIIDSGLLIQIIGQRDSVQVNTLLKQLVLLIEEDERLIPGTVNITPTDNETFYIMANTYKYGAVSLQAT